jgi:hypothetical protein
MEHIVPELLCVCVATIKILEAMKFTLVELMGIKSELKFALQVVSNPPTARTFELHSSMRRGEMTPK